VRQLAPDLEVGDEDRIHPGHEAEDKE